MAQAGLRIEIPEGPWIGDVSRRYPGASFRVLAAFPAEEADREIGFGLIEVRAAALDSLLAEIGEHETMEECTVLQRAEDAATIQIRTSTPMILLAARRAGVPVEMPVEIRDGTATVEISGAHDRLSELGSRLTELGLDFEVEYIQERHPPERLLTDRQRELLAVAIERGYYDTPRRCTLTELAEETDIAKSTCSEILQRIEETVVKEFVDRLVPEIDVESGAASKASR